MTQKLFKWPQGRQQWGSDGGSTIASFFTFGGEGDTSGGDVAAAGAPAAPACSTVVRSVDIMVSVAIAFVKGPRFPSLSCTIKESDRVGELQTSHSACL